MTWALCRDLTGLVLSSAVNGEGKDRLFNFKDKFKET
jgi:hypothetical protein